MIIDAEQWPTARLHGFRDCTARHVRPLAALLALFTAITTGCSNISGGPSESYLWGTRRADTAATLVKNAALDSEKACRSALTAGAVWADDPVLNQDPPPNDFDSWEAQKGCRDQLHKLLGYTPSPNPPVGGTSTTTARSAPNTQNGNPATTSSATSPEARRFFEALEAAQILQQGSVYSSDVLAAANRACAGRASGQDVTSMNTSVGQDLRARGLDWVSDDVAGGIVSIAFTQLCPR